MFAINISTYFLVTVLIIFVTSENTENEKNKLPTIFIAILVRNKAHILPYFLTLLSRLDYPKNRIHVWIRSDHNVDNSKIILEKWASSTQFQYHNIDLKIDNTEHHFEDEKTTFSWSESRFKWVIKLKQEAIHTAREVWADYIWFLDADSLITNSSTLQGLLEKEKLIVAPMLLSTTMYSNFWCGMTSSFYYERTEEYPEILNRKKIGCFAVPMVHSAVLIDLRKEASDLLTFEPNNHDYTGPIDDIITFAVLANKSGIPLYICNDMSYGYTMTPLEENETFDDDIDSLIDLKLRVSVDEPVLPVDEIFTEFLSVPTKHKFGFDEIFIINLRRRTERRERMEYCLNELGIQATFVDAVDGKNLSDYEIDQIGIKLMPNYEDPHYKRPMKKGEIGCFLSHFNLWKKMVEKNYQTIVILEDDVNFEKSFPKKLQELIDEINRIPHSWDLVYVGRKILDSKKESFFDGSSILVYPYYTYWTIGYILNIEGAKKLLRANPLENLIPVDEFLPIMFDQHPREDWKEYFPERSLRALSVHPLLINPMKYTFDHGYVSDTENSNIIETDSSSKDEL